MKRRQLYEFNDQSWLPGAIRIGMTDFLETISRLAGLHEPMTPRLAAALEASGAQQIVDLCSGSGGPLGELLPALPRPVPVLLTDLYPAKAAAAPPAGMRWHPEPVDALDCDLPGLRTLFNAFHHFAPESASQILRSAFEQRQPIAIFEVSTRSVAAVMTTPLIAPLVCLVVPLIRPARLSTWALTYLLPALPVLTAWDGMVSHLRAYTVEELRAMTAPLQALDYRWEIERVSTGPGAFVTSLTGVPVQRG